LLVRARTSSDKLKKGLCRFTDAFIINGSITTLCFGGRSLQGEIVLLYCIVHWHPVFVE
jgi:hypothetical protein